MPRVIDAEIVLPYLGGGGKIKSISENGVELPIDSSGNVNVTVPTKVSELENDEQFVKDSDLAGVAKSGDYNDLENTPAIPVVPTNVSDFNNDAGYVTKDVDNLSNYTKTEDLGDAALSNDYNDLDNLPTIPSLTGYATESYVNSAIGTHNSAVDAHTDIRTAIGNVDNKISSAADASNPAMDKNFINSSINNATATFQGSYNIVNDLNLSVSATHAQVATALDNTITGANKNDYCNVEIPSTSYSIFEGYDQFTSVDDYVEKYVVYNSVYTYVTDSNKNSLNITPRTTEAYLNNFLMVDRYKYVEVEGGTDYWDFDHTYNNSGFTADQWGSINSKATEAKINQIGTNTNDITNIEGDLYQNFPYIGTSTNWGTSASNCYLRTNYFQGGIVPQKEGDLVYSTGTRNFHRCGPLVWDSGQNCYKTNPVFILHVGEDNVQADWSQSNSAADDFIKNKPSIPTVYDGVTTLQLNGTQIDTFSANQSGNNTINIEAVPTFPTTSNSTTLVAGKLNTLGSVDYSTIALPATPGTAEYNGTFTSTTSGDITVSLPLTYWIGDTDIVAGKTYSFSIQNGVGFIIQLD